jgi:hypothetical protein
MKRAWAALAGLMIAASASADQGLWSDASYRPDRRAVAEAAYRGVKHFRTGPGTFEFPYDNTGEGGKTYTKPTNIGLDLLSALAAAAHGDDKGRRVRDHVLRVVDGLEHLKTYWGIFPEYIKLEENDVYEDAQDGKVRLSSIDSAWLHFALSVAAAHYKKEDPVLAARMRALVEQADYKKTFVHEDGKRFRHGVTVSTVTGQVVEEWPHDYDNKNSEARLLIAYLVATGKVPASVWDNMFYKYVDWGGLSLAEGWKMNAFVEMTGNSYFSETSLAPDSLGTSHRNYLKAAQRLAGEKELLFYGWGPCFGPEDQYTEYGLERPDVVTPYAAALLTTWENKQAWENLLRLLGTFPSEPAGPYPDAVDSRTGKIVNRRSLSLDQNLLFHAVVKEDMRRLVAKTPWAKRAAALLKRMDKDHPRP